MNAFAVLSCRHCGSTVPDENADPTRLVAHCAACEAVFSYAEEVGYTAFKRTAVPMPRGFDIRHEGWLLTLVRSWREPRNVALGCFAVAWDGFLTLWFYLAFMEASWPMASVGALPAVVGVGLLYVALAGFVNGTTVQVDRRGLGIQHGPLPWFGGRQIPIEDVAELYCRARHHRSGTHVRYDLYALCHRRGLQELLRGLHTAEQVLFIEQEIGRHLNLRPSTGAVTEALAPPVAGWRRYFASADIKAA